MTILPKVDAISLQVIYHRLQSIANEMEVVLLKSAYSPLIRECRDCSSAIFDAKGRTIAQAVAIPAMLGSLSASIPAILAEFPVAEMKEGDVFISNDPYRGGAHLPDITVVVPVFFQGEVVALCASIAHHQDIGAMRAGGSNASTSIYQEGLLLPAVKFYDAGRPVRAIHQILRNNIRTPDVVLGDLGAQISGGNVGSLRIQDLVSEFGKPMLLAAIEQLLDGAEQSTRAAIAALPQGTFSFTDYIDNDGIELDKRVKVQVEITIEGSDITVDFTGTNGPVKGSINVTPSAALAAIAYAVRVVTDPTIPNNDGCLRPIKMILPESSLVNATRPAPLNGRGTTLRRVASVVLGALLQVLPERLNAGSNAATNVLEFGGIHPATGKEWIVSFLEQGGLGARPSKDGLDTISTETTNVLSVPCEALELNYPLRVVECGIRDGSGGAGEYRGGLGVRKVFELLAGEDVVVGYAASMFVVSPWGAMGGKPGATGEAFVLRKDGTREDIPSRRDFYMQAGDQLHMFTAGGGGYGDALKRSADRVLADVNSRRISIAAAREDYGVVLDAAGRSVDAPATLALRQELAAARGEITWIFDRGAAAGKDRHAAVIEG